MTTALRLDWTMPDTATGRLAVVGELNFQSAGRLIETVTEELARHPELRELRLDCTGLDHCDSSGLSVLLMAQRRTQAAGVTLYLDNRSSTLERMLELTGTVDYLAGDAADDRSQSS